MTLATIIADAVRDTMHECHYNQRAAARVLGISREALSRLLTKYNLPRRCPTLTEDREEVKT